MLIEGFLKSKIEVPYLSAVLSYSTFALLAIALKTNIFHKLNIAAEKTTYSRICLKDLKWQEKILSYKSKEWISIDLFYDSLPKSSKYEL